MEQTVTEEKEAPSSFDMGRFITILAKNFYWFLITLALFITLAYLYLRYTQPLYKVSTYILIHVPDSGPSAMVASPFSDAAAAGMNTTDPANEIFKLQSEVLLGRVVDSLRLDIAVMSFGRVRFHVSHPTSTIGRWSQYATWIVIAISGRCMRIAMIDAVIVSGIRYIRLPADSSRIAFWNEIGPFSANHTICRSSQA